jgi:DNA end-binding protein Ku
MSSNWNPEKYKDDYRDALIEVIEEKVETGGKEIREKPKQPPKATKVIDLVSVLQKSLEQTAGQRRSRQPNPARNKSSLQRKQRECSGGM